MTTKHDIAGHAGSRSSMARKRNCFVVVGEVHGGAPLEVEADNAQAFKTRLIVGLKMT